MRRDLGTLYPSCCVSTFQKPLAGLRLIRFTCRNILQRRYDIPESSASEAASYLLAGSVILYPIVRVILCSDQH